MNKEIIKSNSMKCFQIPVKIEEIIIDYVLTINENGGIESVTPMIYELPEITQKLILGNKKDILDRQIQAYSGLIYFILPLLLNNRLESLKEPYAEVIKYLKTTPTSMKKPLEDYWDRIEFLIENRKARNIFDAIGNFAFYHRDIVTEFFPAIIPFFESNAQRKAFEGLEYGDVEKLKPYLLKELETPLSDPYASGILKALSRIKVPSDDVFNAVIAYYYREGNKSEDILGNLTVVLRNYPNDKSKSIGLELLKRNQRYCSGYAARLLVETFKANKEVADLMMPHFLAADPRISEASFHIFCNNPLAEYLPNPEIVLDVFVETLSKGRNANVSYAMPTISTNTGAAHLYDKIYALLNHQSASVKEGILILISCIIDEAPYSNYRSSRFVDKFLELAFDKDTEVARSGVHLVSKVVKYNKEVKYVDVLLKIITENEKNVLLRLQCMRGINSMFSDSDIPYQPQIEPLYLKALEESNYNYREAALNGLRFSPNLELKKSLAKYQNDPSKEVRNAALRLMEPTKRGTIDMNSLIKELKKRGYKDQSDMHKKESKFNFLSKIASFFKR